MNNSNNNRFGNTQNKGGTPNSSNNKGIKELQLYEAINHSKIETVKELFATYSYNQNTKDVYLIKTISKYNKNKTPAYLEVIEILLEYVSIIYNL